MKILLDGVEVTKGAEFFADFNWENFNLGDKVYVEDCDAPETGGHVHLLFIAAHDGNVFLWTEKQAGEHAAAVNATGKTIKKTARHELRQETDTGEGEYHLYNTEGEPYVVVVCETLEDGLAELEAEDDQGGRGFAEHCRQQREGWAG